MEGEVNNYYRCERMGGNIIVVKVRSIHLDTLSATDRIKLNWQNEVKTMR